MYTTGKVCMGKTALLLNRDYNSVYNGKGIRIRIDTHEDPAEKLLGYIPKWRIKSIYLF